jgi:uncharacterized NAD-dependent epimerase/dehydratase family protein
VDGWDKIARRDVIKAIDLKLNVDCGLHDFLSEDEKIARQAEACARVILRDIRKPPSRNRLHFFSGKIEQVDTLKIAVLGTDSAVGKRTTAWLMVQAFEQLGYSGRDDRHRPDRLDAGRPIQHDHGFAGQRFRSR